MEKTTGSRANGKVLRAVEESTVAVKEGDWDEMTDEMNLS